MKPTLPNARWFFVPLAFSLFTTVAHVLAEDTTVDLAVKVQDEGAHAVSMARVNIYQGFFSGNIAVPPWLQDDTNTSGLARFKIPVAHGQALNFSIEVGREDMQSEIRPINPGTKFATRMLEKFTLKARPKTGGSGERDVITVAIDVQNEKFDFLEGARVIIRPSGGLASETYSGVTNGEGRATIPVWWASASPELAFGVEVSKEGYQDKKITIQLNEQQVGKTIRGGGVTLEMIGAGTIKTIVTVLNKKNNQPVGDAKVVLDGGGGSYYSDTTNGGGNVTFYVSKAGGFTVQISQDNYFPFTGEARLLKDQPEIPLEFKLEPKANKDLGEDTIEVTVLGKDATDEKSKPAPIKGAYVKAGTISQETDKSGVATLTAAFAESQEVTVQANGYKTKTQNVRVNKILHMSAGSGKTTFTLDPELSDSSPIRLSIEVRDNISGKAVPKARVDISTAGGEYLTGTFADDAGNFPFNSSEFEQDISVLRKGLVIDVKAGGYKEVGHRSVPADMLKPSTKTGEFIVQLDRDWSDLEAALAALEQKVAAWQKDRGSVSQTAESDLIEKARAAQKHAAQVLKEIEAAKEAFGITFSPGGPDLQRCRKAKELKEDVQLCEAKANQKAEELKRLLDAASASAANCSAEGDPDIIKKDCADATRLLIEIGALNKKVGKDHDELVKLAKESSDGKKLLADMDAKLAEIGGDKRTADETLTKATALYARFNGMVKGFAARRLQLYTEFGDFKSNYHVVEISPPPNLETRIQAVENALNPQDSVPDASKPKTVPESVSGAPGIIAGFQGKAEQFVSRYRSAACEVDTMDKVVDGIYNTFTDASFEVGMGADLPKQADDCAKKIAEGNNVDVPDLSTLNDLGAMIRAADSVGMVLQPTATVANPPGGSQRLFGPQNPPAKSKAKKGDPLTILVYQKLVEKATPTPGVVLAPTPTPTAADEYVDVPSVASAKDAGAMTKMLGNAGFTAVFHAATPKKKEDELKYAGQDPVGLVKKSEMQLRGNQVVVSINQSWQLPATAQATPTPELAKPGTMPKLIGLTLDQAAGQLGPGFRIGSDEVGDAPPSPELALTIYGQFPTAGHSIPPDTITVVAVRRYGEARSVATADASPDASPVPSPGDKAGGATDITDTTTSSGLWRGQSTPAKSPPPSRTTSKKTTARKPSAPPPPSRKKKMSDWWRRQGHDRPDYEVPQ